MYLWLKGTVSSRVFIHLVLSW